MARTAGPGAWPPLRAASGSRSTGPTRPRRLNPLPSQPDPPSASSLTGVAQRGTETATRRSRPTYAATRRRRRADARDRGRTATPPAAPRAGRWSRGTAPGNGRTQGTAPCARRTPGAPPRAGSPPGTPSRARRSPRTSSGHLAPSRGGREVALEVGAYDGTSAVQQHPLVATRDVEQVAHLVGGVPVEVAQRDHNSLAGRKVGQGSGDDLAHLAGQRDLLRPLLGEPAPAAGVRVPQALEPLGVHRRAGVVGCQAGERHRPAFLD